MKMTEITDFRSHAIVEYTMQLSKALNGINIRIQLANWSNIFNLNKDIKHFQYSNSTVKVIIPLIFSKNNIVTIHDVVPRNLFWRKYLISLIYRIIDIKAKKIIVHSKYSKKLLLSLFPFINNEKVLVIPYGTLLKKYSTNKYINLRKKYGLNQKEIIFLYIGYIKKSKGVIETIEAFNSIKRKSTKLVFIGKVIDSEVKEYIKKIKNNRILLLGFVSDKEMEDWLTVSDTLVNLRNDSVGETSASVINMINFGKPVIATNIGSNREIIQNAGLLCHNDVNSIKKTFTKYIETPKLRKKLRSNALIIRKEYSWKKIAMKYMKVISNNYE